MSIELLAKLYREHAHAMQSGVAMELEHDPKTGTPKHLRVGVNVALCDHAALVKLLVAKGVLTDHEYAAAIADEMDREVKRYEADLTKRLGVPISLL